MEKPLIHVNSKVGINVYGGKKPGFTSYVPSLALVTGFIEYLREAGTAFGEAAGLNENLGEWDIEINDDDTITYVTYRREYGDMERVVYVLSFVDVAEPLAAGTRLFLKNKAEAERKQRLADEEAERRQRILSAPIAWHPQESEMDTLRRLAKKHEFELVYRGMS